MEHEYKISTGYKIFYGFLSSSLAGFGIFLLTTTPNPKYAINGVIIALVLFIVAALFALFNLKRKIIISENLIIVKGFLGSKQAYIHDVKGFRNKGKGLISLYLNDGRKKINIYSSEVFAKSEQLLQWMDDNLRNLDNEEYEAEKVLILQDKELGFTEEERKQVFAKAGTQAMVFNILGLLLLVISIFFKGQFFPYAVFILFYPFAGLVIMAINKGLVKLYSKKSSAYPSLLLGTLFSGGALILQSSINDSLLNFDRIWSPLLIGVLAITVVIVLLLRQANDFKKQILAAALVSFVLSFGAVRQTNKIFDRAEPQKFTVNVVGRYINTRKFTSYHIVIAGWKFNPQEKDIMVSSELYDQLNGNPQVNVNLKPGILNIPWYYISQ